MVLNRKSAKKTSRVSLFVALTMLSTVVTLVATNGYSVEGLAVNGKELCQLGVAELFSALFW